MHLRTSNSPTENDLRWCVSYSQIYQTEYIACSKHQHIRRKKKRSNDISCLVCFCIRRRKMTYVWRHCWAKRYGLYHMLTHIMSHNIQYQDIFDSWNCYCCFFVNSVSTWGYDECAVYLCNRVKTKLFRNYMRKQKINIHMRTSKHMISIIWFDSSNCRSRIHNHIERAFFHRSNWLITMCVRFLIEKWRRTKNKNQIKIKLQLSN